MFDMPSITNADPIVIPSRELTGTRETKLAQLDEFLAQLHVVRLALGGQPTSEADLIRKVLSQQPSR